jgi:O-antigen/teichoic acid export membrane protein
VLAASVANGLFQGAGRFAVWNAMRLFAAIAYAGFVLAVWGAGWVSVTHIAMASLAGAGLTLAVLLVLLAREGWIGWRADPAEMRRILVFCLPIAMGSAILVIGERIDQIVLSQTQDEAAFGLYVVAASLGGAANGFVGLLGALALPKIAAIEDREARAAMLGRFLRLGAALGVVLAVMLAVLAAWVVRVLYGEAFVEAASLVRVLAVAAIPFGVKQLLIQGSKAHGQTAFLTRIELATVAAGVAALLALVPTLGTIGAAWSFVLSQSTGAIVAAVYARRHLDVDVLVLFKPHADDWRRAWDALTVRRP